MQTVRIYELPNCKMVSSGIGMFGEPKFDRFCEWMSKQPRGLFPKDFLFYDRNGEREGFRWLYLYENGMTVPDEFEIIDFAGGFYAMATGVDQQTDMEKMDAEVDRFIAENGFETDESRPKLGNVITSPRTRKIMGFEQMDYYTPIKEKLRGKD